MRAAVETALDVRQQRLGLPSWPWSAFLSALVDALVAANETP